MTNKKEFHITISSSDKTALDWLAGESGFSRQKIKQCMQQGCVWREHQQKQGFIQRIRRAKKIVEAGDILHFYYDESVLSAEPKVAELVSDLGDYSIWNKPSGMFSQGSKWGDHCTIYRWAEKHLQPQRSAFVVHRLDRAASGLIILAHKKKVASQFSKMFEQRAIEKYYRVVVEGDFSSVLKGDEKVLTIKELIDEKGAVSHCELLSFDPDENTSLLHVQIETGRKHQIRKHLSGMGFPVVGDRLYGSGKYSENLQLMATSLSFKCPVTGEQKSFSLRL